MRAFAVLPALLLTWGALAADPATVLRDALARLEAASSPEQALVALGSTIEAHEASLVGLRATLRAMPAREAEAVARFGGADGARLATLAALHAAARAPVAMRLFHPAGAVGAARGAMLLGDVAATLTRRQAALQAAIEDIASLASEKKTALDDLSRSLADLAAARAEMTAQLSARARPEPREADRLLAKALAESGATLSDLALLLDRLSPDTAEIAVQRALFDEAVGTLPLPVLGDAVAEGNTVVIATDAYALARAPWLSTVRHAGAVGLLGGVLVLEPAPGVLISLRGLGVIERQTAEIVGVGEPLGHMGGAVPATEEFLIAATDSAAVAPQRRLYIDVWRDGQAERAAAWFGLEQ